MLNDMSVDYKTIYDEKLFLKPSEIHGTGLHTSVNIKEGALVAVITGEVIDADECVRREDEEDNVYIFYNGEDCYIDAEGNEMIRHLNHNCDYNCEVEDGDESYLLLVAARNISAGEELTIDYGYEEIYENCNCTKCKSREAVKES